MELLSPKEKAQRLFLDIQYKLSRINGNEKERLRLRVRGRGD